MLVIAMEVITGTGGNFCFTFEDMMQVLSIVRTMEVLIMKSIVPFCVSVLGFILSSEYSFLLIGTILYYSYLNFSLSIKVGLVGYYSTAHFSVSGFVNCADGVL